MKPLSELLINYKGNKTMAKSLEDYAKEQSNFISLKDGEHYDGIYRGYKYVEKEMRGETNEYVRFMIEDLVDNRVRNLDSRSGRLARKMGQVIPGTKIKITRSGESFETDYKIETSEGEIKIGKAIDKAIGIDTGEIPVIEE